MKKLLLAFLCVLTLGIAARSAEQSYTITFKTAYSDPSGTISTSTSLSSIIASGADYLSGIKATNNVYAPAINGLKFSSSKANGAIEFNLSSTGKVKATKIVVNAASWYNASTNKYADSGNTKISVNGATAVAMADDFADYTFNLDGSEIATLKIAATKRIVVKSVTVTYEAAAANTVAAPTFSKDAGKFSEPFDLTLSCATEGATIYYTTDGTQPQAVIGDMYAGNPIHISSTTTVKAFAVKSGMTDSGVAEATYTYFNNKCANIAEWLTKAAADKTNVYEITGEVTVSYNANTKADGTGYQYTYVQDATGSLLVYAVKNNHTPGQTLTGLKGDYADYKNLIEMTNSNVAILTPGTGTAPQPVVTAISAITASDMNKYVKVAKATFDPTAKTLTQGTDNIAVFYRFAGVDVPTEAGEYDVEGFVCVYGTTLQIYPTKFTAVAQEANISWSAESVNFTWEPNYASKLPTLNNPDNVAVTYASSNTELATIDTNGKVTLIKPGEVTISATAGTKTVSYTLTVGVVNMIAQQLITWEGTTDLKYTATIGANNTFPTIKIAEGYELLGTVYDAFAQAPAEGFTGNVATINAADGQITLVNPGTCRIGYIWGAGNHFIAADNFNYELTVLPAAVTSNVAWSATSAQVTFNSAGTYTLPTLSNPDNVAVTYASSDTNVATVDNAGKVTVLKPGSTTISAKYDTDKEATYALVVDKIHFTVTFSGLTEGAFTATMGQTNNYPTYTVEPAAEKETYWFGVVYQSSNTDVATIAPDGTVTLNGVGETEIRIVNGGNDYVMGDNYPAYKLIVVAGQADLQAPVIEAYMSTDMASVENGGSIAQADAPVYISVENPNADTTMTVYVMKAPSADDLDNLQEFETVENFTGSTWNARLFPKDPGFYYISAMVMNADMSKDAYAEFSFTIQGDVVQTYIDPIISFTDAEGNAIETTSAEAPVTFNIENQNPSGANSSIYYFITTSETDPEYTKSDENVEAVINVVGEYRYKAYIASYNGSKLTGTSQTVEGTFTVLPAKPKEPTFVATDKDGAPVANQATVAEDKAPVTVVITNPYPGQELYISVANIDNGSSNDYQTTEATYTVTLGESGQWGVGAMQYVDGNETYAEFDCMIEGEIRYNLAAPYVEFLDADDEVVESPANKLPLRMVIASQNYYEGVQMIYTINGEEKTSDENYVEIELTQPGTVTYSVYCKLGTKSVSATTEGTYEITAEAVKLAAPTITFTTPEGETEPVTVTITNPNLNGAGTILYSIGTSAWFEGDGATVTFTLPNDGVYTVRAYVRNNTDETLNSDITTEEYILDGIESIGFGAEGVKVVGGHIMVPEGAEVYSIGGMRVNTLDRVAAGIYIVRLANGTTTKVIVK